jgi:hypothetical protein
MTMTTIKDATPCEPAIDRGGEDPAIGVRILIPEIALFSEFYPTGSRWATQLLSRLLRSCIESTGVAVKGSYYTFPFGRATYLFRLVRRPAGPALETLREELAGNRLLEFAQIAWRDYDELIWRLYHPASGVFSAPSQEEFASEKLRVEEKQALLRNWLDKHGYASE